MRRNSFGQDYDSDSKPTYGALTDVGLCRRAAPAVAETERRRAHRRPRLQSRSDSGEVETKSAAGRMDIRERPE